MREKSDLSLRGIAIGALIVLVGIAVSLAGAWLMTRQSAVPATGPSRGQPPRIEGPALQTAAPQDLAAYRREKEKQLSSYGRIDDTHVHIPIERAMQILAKGRER
jgi:hypothetical protein